MLTPFTRLSKPPVLRMPCRARADLLSSARAAPKTVGLFGNNHVFGQGINVHVRPMSAGFAHCDDRADTVCAHVRQCDRRAESFADSRRT
jgi:hypothetical protein